MSKYQELPIKIEAFVFQQKGDDIKVLLLKRSEVDGGFWQPVTGTLEFDETLRGCLLREIAEETGIKDILNVSDEIYRFSWQKKDYTVVEMVWGVRVDAVDVVLSEEHTEFKWCNPDEVISFLEKENNKKAFEEFLKSIS